MYMCQEQGQHQMSHHALFFFKDGFSLNLKLVHSVKLLMNPSEQPLPTAGLLLSEARRAGAGTIQRNPPPSLHFPDWASKS